MAAQPTFKPGRARAGGPPARVGAGASALRVPPGWTPQQLQTRLDDLGQRFRTCFAQGELGQARQAVLEVLALLPDLPQALGDLALCEMRLGELPAARQHYEAALAHAPQDVNLLDGLAEACALLGDGPAMRHAGRQALALKDAAACASAAPGAHRPVGAWAPPTPQRLPTTNAPGADPTRHRLLIAYSLFGDLPRYCETAWLNVLAARRLLPQWTCRFYCDDTVPLGVRQRLVAAGAEVVSVDARTRGQLSGLMWRFLALDDPQAQRVLLRDADSLLSTREQAAVQAWMASPHWFHLMRDAPTHTELILAGLWGACGGALPALQPLMAQFMASGRYLSARVVDQHFLRQCVWPTLRQSVLVHDSVYAYPEGQAQPFPGHADTGLGPQFHVGANLVTSSIAGEVKDGRTTQAWRLVEVASGAEVCAYVTPVRQGRWEAHLPPEHMQRLQARQWKLQLAQ